jgi:hypothetical protein
VTRERGCFVRPVNYDLPRRQLVSLILLSGHCEQYVRSAASVALAACLQLDF